MELGEMENLSGTTFMYEKSFPPANPEKASAMAWHQGKKHTLKEASGPAVHNPAPIHDVAMVYCPRPVLWMLMFCSSF